jgi:hypothetical protein
VIDTALLKRLRAIADREPPGHVSIRPEDLALLEEWAASRGGETVHPLTQEILDAIIEVAKRPK